MSKLTPRDHDKVAMWLMTKATPAQVNFTEQTGIVGNERFTNAALLRYEFLWTWSAERFGGHAATLQDRYYRRMGYHAYIRRINRVRRACAAYGLIVEPLQCEDYTP